MRTVEDVDFALEHVWPPFVIVGLVHLSAQRRSKPLHLRSTEELFTRREKFQMDLQILVNVEEGVLEGDRILSEHQFIL